jgi:hypothetical protein
VTTDCQFAHLQWAGKRRSSKRQTIKAFHGSQRGQNWSAADILAEAERKKGHCSHVANPQPANLIYGYPLSKLEEIADNWAKHLVVEVKSKNGRIETRKMRSDAPILASGVISLPQDRMAEWPAFRDHAIQQLKNKYGERLVSAVEHLDESHPHLHFYLVPNNDENFGAVHAGYAASRAARKLEGNLICSSYKAAMREWQDWVQETIGAPFGLARIGPRRARQSNEEWKAEKAKQLLASREAAVLEREAKFEKILADIEWREVLIEKKSVDLDNAHREQMKRIAAQSDALTKEQERVARMVAENEKAASEMKAVFATFEPALQKYLIAEYEEVSRYLADEASIDAPH